MHFVPHGVSGSPWQTPPHFSSLTFPASSLLARKCQQLPRSAGCCVPPSGTWVPPSSVCWAPLLHQRSSCSVVAGFSLTFLLVKSDFQMQERDVSRKSWTQQPELRSLVEGRTLPEVHFPAPAPLFTNLEIPVG